MSDIMAMTGWAMFFVTYIAGWIAIIEGITARRREEMSSAEKSVLFLIWMAAFPVYVIVKFGKDKQ